MSNKKENKYKYPIGDFLSGFSEDQNNPCEYEIECQRMTSRGVEYLDEHPELFERVSQGGISVFDEIVKPMIDYMIEGDYGQTGAMVNQAVKHAYNAKKIGWDAYVKQIVEWRDERVKEEGGNK